jgi:hypothetical protein
MRDPVTSEYVRGTGLAGLFAEAGIVRAISAGRQAEFGAARATRTLMWAIVEEGRVVIPLSR